MSDDRATGIEGDQIQDHTIKPSELDTVDSVNTPKRWQQLVFDFTNDKMKWMYMFGNRIFR